MSVPISSARSDLQEVVPFWRLRSKQFCDIGMDIVFTLTTGRKITCPNYWAGEALGTAISATPRVIAPAIYMH